MNKKVNTVLFILGATAVNIITMLFILLLGIYLIGELFSETAQESVGSVLFILLFFISIGGSFFIYNRVIKFISKKIDMDKYFHPIFRPRKQKPPEN
ncbi:MAG: leader peptide processing enzyme [Spirochaetales bacterium]|nr:leader peptide processing enzyme [Spirochaetales bacterium]